MIFNSTHHCVFYNFIYAFSYSAAIHLFTRSVTKSKISTSPVKKLVAATSCVCKIIHSQTLIAKIYSHTNLPGIFDEKRLDEIF